MKHYPALPLLAAGAATFGALTLSGCGAGNSNNPHIGSVTTTTTTGTTTTTTTQMTSEIVYVADQGATAAAVRKAKPAVTSGPALEAYTLSVTSNGVTVQQLGSTVSTYPGLSAIAIDPTRKYLFALTSPDGPELQVFAINSDGSINSTAVSQQPFSSASPNIHAITVAAPAGAGNAEYVYVAGNAAGAVHGFQFSGGSLTGFATTASSSDTPYTLATDPTGTFLFSGGVSPNITPYTINPSTGAITPITQQAVGTTGPTLLAVDAAHPYLYGYDEGAKILYSYVRSTSGLSPYVTDFTTTNTGNDLAITPTGSALFLSNTSNITEATINPSDGTLNPPTNTAAITGATLRGIAVDATGAYVGTLDIANDTLIVYALSGTTLAATPQSYPLSGTISPIAAVFEPGAATPNARKK